MRSDPISVDDGHKIRLKVLAKEMVRGVEILDSLQSRAYDLYVQKNPFPAWLSEGRPQPNNREPISAENKIECVDGQLNNFKKSGSYTDNNIDLQPESADLIDLELRSFVQLLLIFLVIILIHASLQPKSEDSLCFRIFSETTVHFDRRF